MLLLVLGVVDSDLRDIAAIIETVGNVAAIRRPVEVTEGEVGAAGGFVDQRAAAGVRIEMEEPPALV